MIRFVVALLLAQNLRGDEALSKVLVEGESWQLVGEGYQFTDAVTADRDGNVYFSDLPAGAVHRVGLDGKPSVWWSGAPRISGMKFGPDGRLYAATQAPKKQIIAVDPATKGITVLVEDAQPNDLVVTRKGLVYFTDTGKGQVMLVDRQRKVRAVASGIVKPNGIALTPDEGSLAVSEFGGTHVWAFRIEANGDLNHGAAWMDLRTPVGHVESGGDGMTVDADGRFYVTSFSGIQMFDWTGRLGGVIAKPTQAAISVAFGGPDRSYLFLCAKDKLFRRRMKVGGPGQATAMTPAEVRAAFLKLLDRPRVPADPRLVETKAGPDGLVAETLTIATEKKRSGAIERMPMLLVKPAKAQGRLPVVIVFHGTGGNKEQHRAWCDAMARRGFIAVSIDARYHGQRPGSREIYIDAITKAWRAPVAEQEHPWFYDTVWDAWRLVDYLQTRPDVDGKRIGMTGFSMGGIQTWLAAAVDERVRVAVPAIAVQSFRWSLANEQWQGRAKTVEATHVAAAKDLGEKEVNARVCRAVWNKILPGILDEFDAPSMLRLFAGRPLMIINGELDPNCPIEGAKVAFAAAEDAYKQAGASDKLKIDVAMGVGHKVTDEQNKAAQDWFARWLGK